MFKIDHENVFLTKAIFNSRNLKQMRYPVILTALLIILVSCRTSLFISDVHEQNLQNQPSQYLPDSSIILMVAPYRQKLEADMDKVIAISDEVLMKGKPESNLTNLTADLYLQDGMAYMKKNDPSFVPDMAFVNYGGLRGALPKGKITVGDIFELMPFNNVLVILKISGETMFQFAERIAERGGDGVAGVEIRIKDGKLGSFAIGGRPFDMNRDYWLVTNDYIANGGDDMEMLVNREKYINTELKIRDLVIGNLRNDYQAGKTIHEKLDGRIYNEQ